MQIRLGIVRHEIRLLFRRILLGEFEWTYVRPLSFSCDSVWGDVLAASCGGVTIPEGFAFLSPQAAEHFCWVAAASELSFVITPHTAPLLETATPDRVT